MQTIQYKAMLCAPAPQQQKLCFHKKLAGNVAIGEETGSLDTMLISAADNFEYESEQAISRLISFLEPAMIIVMAVIVGMIMIAVMLPLLNMYAEIEASGTM